jgi:hypothetical protein
MFRSKIFEIGLKSTSTVNTSKISVSLYTLFYNCLKIINSFFRDLYKAVFLNRRFHYVPSHRRASHNLLGEDGLLN